MLPDSYPTESEHKSDFQSSYRNWDFWLRNSRKTRATKADREGSVVDKSSLSSYIDRSTGSRRVASISNRSGDKARGQFDSQAAIAATFSVFQSSQPTPCAPNGARVELQNLFIRKLFIKYYALMLT